MLKGSKRSGKENGDALGAALKEWKDALARFETASNEEIRYMALEVEAARQKYMLMLKQNVSK